MSSQRKSDTARANGAKSTGPKTVEGRERSSRNSLKHGITSRNNMLLACEDPADFQIMMDEYTARIRRLKTIEVALVDYEMAVKMEEIQKKLTKPDNGIHMAITFKGISDESRATSLLTRYQSRLHRIYHRSHEAFLDLRRAMAAGLIGQPPATPSPEPPAPEPPPERIKSKNEPTPEPTTPPNPGSSTLEPSLASPQKGPVLVTN